MQNNFSVHKLMKVEINHRKKDGENFQSMES